VKTMTFLQLSQEFGGTRFGPFEQVEICLGSEPDQNDITLPAELGVAPQHVKVLKQQDETFILAPVDRTAALFFFRSTGGKAKQVTAPLACKAGDSFALVTPEGPRFFLQSEKNPKDIAAAAAESEGPGWGGINKPNIKTEGIVNEIKRRGFAAVFTTRLGNMWMNAWRMIKTGQIFSPVYIVGGMLMLFGWLGVAGSGCAMMRLSTQRNTATKQLTECRDQAGLNSENVDGDPTTAQLTQKILVDPTWKDVIVSDAQLREAYVNALKAIYADPTRYEWVYKRANSPYAALKKQLEAQGLPENLVRVLAFTAARGRVDQTWHRMQDSEAKTVCGRGPMGLTYRTARNLGLAQLQPDALVEGQVAGSGDIEKQRQRLDETLKSADDERQYREDLIVAGGTNLQGGLQCLYIDGEDDRENPREIATALRRKIGAGAGRLPSEGSGFWVATRLMMLYAHDFRYDLERVDFDAKTAPSTRLQAKEVPDGNISFAVKETAAVMARAAAIPCMARFDKEQREPPKWFIKEPPLLGQCAILQAYVAYDRME